MAIEVKGFKAIILLSGQLRTARTVWPINKTLLFREGELGLARDYEIYLVTSNTDLKSEKRRTSEETEALARKIYGDHLKAIEIVDDVSMAEEGTWLNQCVYANLDPKMYDNGTNAFNPLNYYEYQIFHSTLKPDYVERLKRELTKIHPRYQEDIRYKKLDEPYATPFSGRELQFHKRARVWNLYQKNKPPEEILQSPIIITRPDFIFEAGSIRRCVEANMFSSSMGAKLWVYPLHEYKFSDVFAVADETSAQFYCSPRIFGMVRMGGFVELDRLYDNLISKTSNPNACENIHSYYTIPPIKEFELKYISNNPIMFMTNIIR